MDNKPTRLKTERVRVELTPSAKRSEKAVETIRTLKRAGSGAAAAAAEATERHQRRVESAGAATGDTFRRRKNQSSPGS